MFDAGMSFALGEEIEALRETTRRWAQDKLSPRAAEIDASNTFARDLWPELGALGLLGHRSAQRVDRAGDALRGLDREPGQHHRVEQQRAEPPAPAGAGRLR